MHKMAWSEQIVDGLQFAQNASVACPACGYAATTSLEEFHRSWRYACAGCDLHFWYPVAMPDTSWHECVYQGRDQTAMPLEPGHRFFLGDSRAPKSGHLLDLGCGVGNFLAAARDVGFRVAGIDLNRNALRFAQEHYSLRNVFVMRPEEFASSYAGERFDVVTFFEVLEHQENPTGFLQVADRLLAERGFIALSVPNRNRWQKGIETLDYPPNHLTRWSPRALRKFLECHGFEILSLVREPLRVRRVAQVLSARLRTGMVSRISGRETPTLADLFEMDPKQRQQTTIWLATDRKLWLAGRLVRLKNFALLPLAALIWPFLRLRGHTGLYLYCLARKRPAGLGSGVIRARAS